MRYVENRMVIDSEWDLLYKNKPVCKCISCDADLYEGDKAYRIGGEFYCEECIDDFSIYL